MMVKVILLVPKLCRIYRANQDIQWHVEEEERLRSKECSNKQAIARNDVCV